MENQVSGKTVVRSKEQIDADLVKIEAWIKKLLKDDWDKFDYRAQYDPTLSLDENKQAMREKLKAVFKDAKEKMKEAVAAQEQFENEKKLAAEKEVKQYNESLTFTENKDLDKYYEPITRIVNKICQGYSNLGFIKGRGGIGKSYNIRKCLVQNKADFFEVCGEVTEAYLYRLIYENNGKIIWFKDVNNLLRGLGSINMLKAATETEDTKVLTKSNYSKQQDDLPNTFVCRCKFIFDYNHIQHNLKEDFEALISRGDYAEMAVSDDDIKNMMTLIMMSKSPEEKEVTEYIIKEFESNGYVKMNLRTQYKAIKTYNYALKNGKDWKAELKTELKNISKTRAMLYTLIGNRAVRTADLKRLMMRNELASSLRTAHRMVADWLYMEELYSWGGTEDKNFYVSINPKPDKVQ